MIQATRTSQDPRTFDDTGNSTASLGGRRYIHPLHPGLAPYSTACFIAALITDVVYWRTYDFLWVTFSDWLLTGGLLVAAVVVLAVLVDLLRGWRPRRMGSSLLRGLAYCVALGLATVNAFVHGRDGYTSVVPTGLTLSVVVVAILVLNGLVGWTLASRRQVGVVL